MKVGFGIYSFKKVTIVENVTAAKIVTDKNKVFEGLRYKAAAVVDKSKQLWQRKNFEFGIK